MTAIAGLVAKGKVYLGGDSAVSLGEDEQWLCREAKVWECGEWLIGAAGSARGAEVLRYSLRLPGLEDGGDSEHIVRTQLPAQIRKACAESGLDNDDASGVSALVGLRGKLYLVDGRGAVVRPAHPFAAIGTGAMCALGAFHVTKGMDPIPRLKAVLGACAAYCQGVRGPFSIVVTP